MFQTAGNHPAVCLNGEHNTARLTGQKRGEMEYVKIPYVEKEVSKIIFGTAVGPITGGDGAFELLDAAFGMGINTFDTARVYGKSENNFGKWIAARGLRDQINIITKGAHPLDDGIKRVSREEIRKDVELSREALGTDFFEVYLLHRDDPDVPVGQILEILNELHEEGAIGAFGGSNWTRERIQEANEYAAAHGLVPMAVSSPNFGLAEQVCDVWGGGCTTVAGPDHIEDRAWYVAQNMQIIAYSSLARGVFAGMIRSDQKSQAAQIVDAISLRGYCSDANFERLARAEKLSAEKGCSVAQLTLAYTIRHPEMNVFAVCTSSSPERVRSNVESLQVKLTEEEIKWLDLRA